MPSLRGFFARLKRNDSYLAMSEYWVFATEPNLPSQEDVMNRLIRDNPHNRRGLACIGAREGMVLSDIRLAIGLATRAKNPHVFRPDLLADHMEVTKELLEAFAASKVLYKLRYYSDETLIDHRHLQFMPHLADAYASAGSGVAIYDCVAEQAWTKDQFYQLLDENPQIWKFEQNVRAIWIPEETGGRVRVLGLPKIGGTVWETEITPADQRLLATEAMLSAAKMVYDMGRTGQGFPMPNEMDALVLDVALSLKFNWDKHNKLAQVRIFRTAG